MKNKPHSLGKGISSFFVSLNKKSLIKKAPRFYTNYFRNVNRACYLWGKTFLLLRPFGNLLYSFSSQFINKDFFPKSSISEKPIKTVLKFPLEFKQPSSFSQMNISIEIVYNFRPIFMAFQIHWERNADENFFKESGEKEPFKCPGNSFLRPKNIDIFSEEISEDEKQVFRNNDFTDFSFPISKLNYGISGLGESFFLGEKKEKGFPDFQMKPILVIRNFFKNRSMDFFLIKKSLGKIKLFLSEISSFFASVKQGFSGFMPMSRSEKEDLSTEWKITLRIYNFVFRNYLETWLFGKKPQFSLEFLRNVPIEIKLYNFDGLTEVKSKFTQINFDEKMHSFAQNSEYLKESKLLGENFRRNLEIGHYTNSYLIEEKFKKLDFSIKKAAIFKKVTH
ncbi:MAG: hypothetical protein HQM08_03115 [Candidatus Riflebacteria bacterium]|nr:hypothetical protein [Candidatus Riflebacteria bacterium]